MNKPFLVVAYYFHQLFPALTALTYYRQLHNLNEKDPIWIQIHHITTREIEIITKAFPWVSFLATNQSFSRIALSRFIPITVAGKIIQQSIKIDFYAIFFPHDVTSDFTAQIFMQSFSKAKRICYGDGLGNLLSKKNFEKHIYQHSKTWRGRLALICRQFKTLGCRWLHAHQTLLMIPLGFSKNCFDALPLEIIPRDHAIKILKNFQQQIVDYNNYIEHLVNEITSQSYLFLPGHLQQAGITTLENEFLLYKEILKNHLPQNSTVVLKPHTGGNFHQIKQLAEWAIQRGHTAIIFSEMFLNIPIEFAEKLIKQCQVLSISYTSISLPYLYGVSVNHVLSDHLIEKYSLKSRKNFMQHYNHIYQIAQKKLSQWNGSEPLYCEN